MNRLLFVLMLLVGASIAITGCTKDGTKDAKGDSKKQERSSPNEGGESRPAKEMIVGRWEGTYSQGGKIAVEFTAFGEVRPAQPRQNPGKYALVGSDSLEMEFDGGKSFRWKAVVSKDELTLTDLEGKKPHEWIVFPGKYSRVTVFSEDTKTAEELISGEWKEVGGDRKIDFVTKKQVLLYGFKLNQTDEDNGKKGMGWPGSYSFPNPYTLRIELVAMQPVQGSVKIANNELILGDEFLPLVKDGKTMPRFQKAKK